MLRRWNKLDSAAAALRNKAGDRVLLPKSMSRALMPAAIELRDVEWANDDDDDWNGK